MRLTLTPAPLELVAAAEPAPDEQAEEQGPRRQIAGLAVPYELEARIGGALVTFAAGAVAIDGAPPLLLGHDPNRPVGVLVSSSEEPGGLRATYSIDATADGDAALTQAASGSRRGLSVGVDVLELEEDPDEPERIRVLAGRLAETSLVAMAAYPGAGVDQIAAHNPLGGAMSEPTPAPAPEPEPHPEPEPAPPARVVIADRGEPDMRLGEYVQNLVRAERGDRGARERIEAALTRSNLAGNPGVVPIAYVNEVIDSLGFARPLFDAMRHAEMPPAGMTIRRPEIITRPNGDWLADDTAGAPSGAVAINNHDEPVKQWAWGGSASVALVERSSPSYVEEVFTQAIRSYYRDVEAAIAAILPTAASTLTTVGPAVGKFLSAYREFPDLLIVGGTAYGKLLDAAGTLMFASGNVDAHGNGSYAGLRVIVSPDVTPADGWVTNSDFQEVRETSPIRLSVSDVTSLSLEIGVTSFFAQTRLRQDVVIAGPETVAGAVRIAGFVPTAREAEGSSSSKK